MDRDDYERRKAALEEIYRADLDLVRAAHEARLRSLEALRLSGAPASASDPAPPPAPEPPAPAPARKLPPHLRNAIVEILPQLPAHFERKDVIAALGWTPSRGSLYRVLLDLAIAGILVVEPSHGRHPSNTGS
jgi:hypothetical protein